MKNFLPHLFVKTEIRIRAEIFQKYCNILPPLLGKKKGRASDRAWAPVWQSRQGASHDGTRTYRPRTITPAHVTREMHQKQCSVFRIQIHMFLGLPDPDPLV